VGCWRGYLSGATPSEVQTADATATHSVFYRPDALLATQPTASKHWRQHTSPTHRDNPDPQLTTHTHKYTQRLLICNGCWSSSGTRNSFETVACLCCSCRRRMPLWTVSSEGKLSSAPSCCVLDHQSKEIDTWFMHTSNSENMSWKIVLTVYKQVTFAPLEAHRYFFGMTQIQRHTAITHTHN